MEMKQNQMKKEKEKRILNFQWKIEERENGLGPKISGYAAVFNKLSDDLGGFREKIKPGAFKKALKNSDVRALFNHDSNYVLGRQSNGTLSLKEDKNGLWMEVDPPDTQIIRDLVLSPIKRGDVKEQSFAFMVEKDEWDNIDGEKKDKPITRTILEINELFDVSPVTYPAYPDTSVALRSMEKAKEGAFSPADEKDILNNLLNQYFESGEEDRETHIIKIIEALLPKLSDESKSKLIPTPEPEGKSTGDDDGIDDDLTDAEKTQQTDNHDPIERINQRFKELSLKSI
jgi:HK97 family phage prohead protease